MELLYPLYSYRLRRAITFKIMTNDSEPQIICVSCDYDIRKHLNLIKLSMSYKLPIIKLTAVFRKKMTKTQGDIYI